MSIFKDLNLKFEKFQLGTNNYSPVQTLQILNEKTLFCGFANGEILQIIFYKEKIQEKVLNYTSNIKSYISNFFK